MSALVPNPFGNLAEASLTKLNIVTYVGLSFFNNSCYLGF